MSWTKELRGMQQGGSSRLLQWRCRWLKWAVPPCSHTLTPFPVESREGMPASTSTTTLLFYIYFLKAACTPCSPKLLPSCSYHVPSQAGLQLGRSAFPGSCQVLLFPGPAALPVHLSRSGGGGTMASRAFSRLLPRNLFCTAAR